MASTSPSSIPSALKNTSRNTLTNLDRTLTRLTSILANPVGTDKFLLTIYYALKLLYPQIARLRSHQTRKFLSAFTNKARFNLLPGESLITILETRDDGFLAQVEAGMRAGASTISDVRMFMRLFALLGVYGMAKRTWSAPPKDTLTKAMAWGQVGSLVGYQVLENVAYLAGKGILKGERFSAEKQTRWFIVACRFWMAYVGLEAGRLLRDWQLNLTEEVRVEEKGQDAVEKRKNDVAAWRRAWYANAAYSPMTVHYSFEQGCLNDEQLGFLGVIVGFIGFGHMWRQTA